ncbi:MAG: RdgB/HAM1 family non-canonical purine NTP pyrophosphatase [Candidatus Dormibacteraeota bacterium]|nr:RdgB/HAM1 family non-canonical purine NTP pyrophosphatase [Candidatus Dormibacteraeota bacterium]
MTDAAPRLLVATSNPGKLAEYRRLLAGSGVAVVSPGDTGLDLEVDEDGATFLANSQKKARQFAAASGLPALADDSGLVVDALGGEPGVQSARYGGPDLDDAGRCRLVLEKMEGTGDRAARFVCVLSLGRPRGAVRDVFVGRCEGRIGREPRGSGGFGYDPIFVFPDGQTMAELPHTEKDLVSHRGHAVREMLAAMNLPRWVGGAKVG